MREKIIKNIIFDLGGVLIDWNPDYVFKKLIKNKPDREYFYKNVCTFEWNENQDMGYPLKKATRERIKLFPEYEKLILAYYGRWEEMLGGEISGTVKILKDIYHKEEFKLLALTNWSSETFPVALKKFKFLRLFSGIVVSGEEKTRKPFDKIYQLTISRYNLNCSETVFIDDNQRNINAAINFGIKKSILFKNPENLEADLSKLKIL
tara:strand:+ start:299 stop:919 length:621 start_codon:yes stop_codon:yes gene_type:complete